MDKYKNDKYDRERYIPKGFILPNGIMLTKEYARLHEDMAERFIMENYYDRFKSDFLTPCDFMIMRLGAIQVMVSGQPIICYCEENQNNFIKEAIVSYASYGWYQKIVFNPTYSYLNLLRYNLNTNCPFLWEDEEYEEKVNKQYLLKRYLGIYSKDGD